MKVYVLIYNDSDDTVVMGVYATAQLAMQAAEKDFHDENPLTIPQWQAYKDSRLWETTESEYTIETHEITQEGN